MSTDELDKWRDAAASLPDVEPILSIPLDVFLGEAIEVARFNAKYWKAQRDEDGRVLFPGLELARGKGQHKKKISSHTGKEIRSLQAAVRQADTAYLFELPARLRA